MAAPRLSISRSRENRRYVGIISSWVGIMIVARIMKIPTLGMLTALAAASRS
jgi:hypothetical protein